MKRVQLIEMDDSTGKVLFGKNEQYTYPQLRKKIKEIDDKYYNHKVLGKIRRAVLYRTLRNLELITDLDKQGKHTLNK